MPNVTSVGSSTLSGGDILFDRTKMNADGTKVCSAGKTNCGDAFLTLVFEHESTHVLGVDDFHDASGNEIDSPLPSVIGGYSGTNNKGFPPVSTPAGFNPGTLPGNLSAITPCDSSTVLNAQCYPDPLSGGGGAPGDNLLLIDPGTDPAGAGVSSPDVYTFTVSSTIIYDGAVLGLPGS